MPADDTTPPVAGQRTLAAIVFTDVVGFTTLARQDEDNALARAARDFALLRQACTDHDGAVLKGTGDGLLCYFNSAVNAVAAALAMQHALREQAATLDPAAVLDHRIAVHLGDVVVAADDVHGDGVNVAARLQSEAEPGGIVLSQTVYDVVRNKLPLDVRYAGVRELRNLSEPVPVYHVLGLGDPGRGPQGKTRHPRTGSRVPWTVVWAGLAGAVVAVALAVVLVIFLRPGRDRDGTRTGTGGGRASPAAAALRPRIDAAELATWIHGRLAGASREQPLEIDRPDGSRLRVWPETGENMVGISAGGRSSAAIDLTELEREQFAALALAIVAREIANGRTVAPAILRQTALLARAAGLTDEAARLDRLAGEALAASAGSGAEADAAGAGTPRAPSPLVRDRVLTPLADWCGARLGRHTEEEPLLLPRTDLPAARVWPGADPGTAVISVPDRPPHVVRIHEAEPRLLAEITTSLLEEDVAAGRTVEVRIALSAAGIARAQGFDDLSERLARLAPPGLDPESRPFLPNRRPRP